MTQPKITVIIPTRERCDVLEHSLRTVTSQNYENLEIIVSDNFSNDDTQGVVARANDRRIRYLNTGKRFSMSHNWEFALSHVTGGWVTFLGDDDGLLPEALQKVDSVITSKEAKVIRTDHCTYDWRGIADRPAGQLIVPLGAGIEERDSRKWLERVLKGRSGYNQLPMIYNGGFIHFSVLKEIKDRTGRFFSSANPDVFTAVAIAKTVPRFTYVRSPLAISGTSRHSNGNSTFSKNKNRNPGPKEEFLGEENIPFHQDVPTRKCGGFPLSLHACVYEAHLQSLSLDFKTNEEGHEKQLSIILATSGKHREEMNDWGEEFAQLHSLDFSRARRIAQLKRLHLGPASFMRKLYRALDSVIIDDPPVSNIHEASIAAGVIRARFSRITTLRFLFTQLASNRSS